MSRGKGDFKAERTKDEDLLPDEVRTRPVFVSPEGDGEWNILVRVQPGARKSEITGVREERLCLRLAAPAVENKANEALKAFVAQRIGLRASRVRLASGETGRQKRLVVESREEPDWKNLLV